MRILQKTQARQEWHEVDFERTMRTFSNCLGMGYVEAIHILKSGESIKVGSSEMKAL